MNLAAAVLALGLAQHTAALTTTPPEYRRTPDQTFLTFPEWYLVHSPAEYAAYLDRSANTPSSFPLFAHMGQFWQSYAAVARESERYPFNGGYHLMVMVIGSSTTVEYGLKGLYEHTVGRIAESLHDGPPVAEERFAARYAQAYVDFIRIEPWYKFDFWSMLKRLWSEVPMRGDGLLRKWERRFALTSELLAKEGYARLIKLGTQSLYDAPKPVTAVVLTHAPRPDAAHKDYLPLGGQAGGDVLATLPRYEAFTTYSRWLAAQGIDFLAIAGNDGEIVVSVLAPAGWRDAEVRPMFQQAILTRPGQHRFVFAVPVAKLAETLRRADASNVVVENVYDF